MSGGRTGPATGQRERATVQFPCAEPVVVVECLDGLLDLGPVVAQLIDRHEVRVGHMSAGAVDAIAPGHIRTVPIRGRPEHLHGVGPSGSGLTTVSRGSPKGGSGMVKHVDLPAEVVRCKRCDQPIQSHMIGEEVVRYCHDCEVVYHAKERRGRT